MSEYKISFLIGMISKIPFFKIESFAILYLSNRDLTRSLVSVVSFFPVDNGSV